MMEGFFLSTRLEEADCDALYTWMRNNDIPNQVFKNDLHCTIFSSNDKIINYSFPTNHKQIKAIPKRFDIFNTTEETKCLVLVLESEELMNRHNMIKSSLGINHVFDKYIPHITLTYNYTDEERNQFYFDITMLPHVILLNSEYYYSNTYNNTSDYLEAKECNESGNRI